MCSFSRDNDDFGVSGTEASFPTDVQSTDRLCSCEPTYSYQGEPLSSVIYPDEEQVCYEPWGSVTPLVRYMSGTRHQRSGQKMRSRGRPSDVRISSTLSDMSWLRLSQRNGCPLNTLQNYDIPAVQIGVEPDTYRYVLNNGVYRSAKNLKAASQAAKTNTFVTRSGQSGLSWEQRVLQREIKRDLRDIYVSKREQGLIKSEPASCEDMTHRLAHCLSNSSISTAVRQDLQILTEGSKTHSTPASPTSVNKLSHSSQERLTSPALLTDRPTSVPPRSPSPVHLPPIAPLPALPLRHDRVTRSLIERLLPEHVTFDKVKQDTEQRFQLWKVRGESRESSRQTSRGEDPPRATVVNKNTFSVQSLHRKNSSTELPQKRQNNNLSKVTHDDSHNDVNSQSSTAVYPSLNSSQHDTDQNTSIPQVIGTVLTTPFERTLERSVNKSLQHSDLATTDIISQLKETLGADRYPTHANSYIPPHPHSTLDGTQRSSKLDKASRAARARPPHNPRRRSSTQTWEVDSGRIVNDRLPGYSISQSPQPRRSSATSARNLSLFVPQLSGKRMNMRVGPQRIL